MSWSSLPSSKKKKKRWPNLVIHLSMNKIQGTKVKARICIENVSIRFKLFTISCKLTGKLAAWSLHVSVLT